MAAYKSPTDAYAFGVHLADRGYDGEDAAKILGTRFSDPHHEHAVKGFVDRHFALPADHVESKRSDVQATKRAAMDKVLKKRGVTRQ